MNISIGTQTSVTRNERKYNFTIPFWLLRVEEVSVCMVEVTFGMDVSSQIRSSKVRAVLKLVLSVFRGRSRWIIVGK